MLYIGFGGFNVFAPNICIKFNPKYVTNTYLFRLWPYLALAILYLLLVEFLFHCVKMKLLPFVLNQSFILWLISLHFYVELVEVRYGYLNDNILKVS